MTRFLVIGSNSFSGAHLVAGLLRQGIETYGVSRSPEPHRVFLPYRWDDPQDGFTFRRIDLNHQLDELMALVQRTRPTHVVNFAAQGMVAQSWEQPEDWYQTNVVAQVRLHDRLRTCDFLEKYVHVSTPEVYGTTSDWQTESYVFAPSTPYAVSRAACDLHLVSFFRAYGFPVVFTRAANVYGPGQLLYRIVPRTMLFGRLGRVLPLHGGGRSVRSFIHIDDVVRATIAIAYEGEPGDTYHLSTREAVSIRDLVERICRMMGLDVEDVAKDDGERLGKDHAYLLDSSHARAVLGWGDAVALEQGLRETLEWVDDNLDVLKDQPVEYRHRP